MNLGSRQNRGTGNRLEISTRDSGGAAVVTLEGEVDLHVSPLLREHLKALVSERRGTIVIDMAAVPYIDSSGVATLVECLQGLGRYGGQLRLAALGERTRSVFEISRLDSIFAMSETVKEALDT
jgi:anti-sigma B factor antagonist